MNRIVSALLVVAALAAPATAFAERFLVVNSVRATGSRLFLTGETSAGPFSREYRGAPPGVGDPDRLAICQRMAIIAMSKPGKWFLDVETTGTNYIEHCTLVRNDPPPPQ